MNNLKELKIWNKAIDLAVAIYKATSHFPTDERFGLASQTRRAAVSISSNIAVGTGRNSSKEFNNFMGIANGSSYELQTQLLIANKLNLITNEMQKMTYAFQKILKSKVEV